MGARSSLPFRWTIVLLLAATGLVQACAGYARSLERATTAPAAVNGSGCCDTSQVNGCAAAGAADLARPCAPECAQPRQTATTEAVGPAVGACVAVSTAAYGRFKYPEKSPVLTAAPPAVSSTPLIYHLQRLLN